MFSRAEPCLEAVVIALPLRVLRPNLRGDVFAARKYQTAIVYRVKKMAHEAPAIVLVPTPLYHQRLLGTIENITVHLLICFYRRLSKPLMSIARISKR